MWFYQHFLFVNSFVDLSTHLLHIFDCESWETCSDNDFGIIGGKKKVWQIDICTRGYNILFYISRYVTVLEWWWIRIWHILSLLVLFNAGLDEVKFSVLCPGWIWLWLCVLRHVLSFAYTLSAPVRYRMASHNSRFTLYGNVLDIQNWFLNVNRAFLSWCRSFIHLKKAHCFLTTFRSTYFSSTAQELKNEHCRTASR